VAKSCDGAVEAIRARLVVKRSARQARSKALLQMRYLGFSAPEQLQCSLKGLSVTALVSEVAALAPDQSADVVTALTGAALRSLAQRVQALECEIAALDALLVPQVSDTAPELLGLFGVGPDTAAVLLAAAGDSVERLASEPAWAHLCGVAPLKPPRAR
jgi:transposase